MAERFAMAVLFVSLLAPAAMAQQDLAAAVARLESHGASATCISVSQQRSLLLSAAHAWQGAGRNKPIVFTAPTPESGPPRTGTRPRLIKLDEAADLALIEVQTELPYVLPVAMQGVPGGPQRCRSIGYDQMTFPAVNVPVTITSVDEKFIYSRQNPVPGRSGGPLVCDGKLVGVCVGFEVSGQRRGLYVSLSKIRKFLGTSPDQAPRGSGRGDLVDRPGAPMVREERSFAAPTLQDCPSGRCPILGKGR
jgi:hypothetical protein